MCPNCVVHHHHHSHTKHHDRDREKLTPDPPPADSLRLEAIKHQILSKLGMVSKPNVTMGVSREVVLQTLYRAQETTTSPHHDHDEDTVPPTTRLPQQDGEFDDFYGRTSEIIAFAESGNTSHLLSIYCCLFITCYSHQYRSLFGITLCGLLGRRYLRLTINFPYADYQHFN